MIGDIKEKLCGWCFDLHACGSLANSILGESGTLVFSVPVKLDARSHTRLCCASSGELWHLYGGLPASRGCLVEPMKAGGGGASQELGRVCFQLTPKFPGSVLAPPRRDSEVSHGASGSPF